MIGEVGDTRISGSRCRPGDTPWQKPFPIPVGRPLLRRVAKGGAVGQAVTADGSEDVSEGRLHAQSVTHIAKRRVAEHLVRQGVPKDKAAQEARKVLCAQPPNP